MTSPVFLLALSFLAAHCVVHAQPQLPDLRAAVVACGMVAGGLAFALWRTKRRFPLARLLAEATIVFVLGAVLATWHATLRLAERWPEHESGADIELTGYIASIVERNDDNQRFRFEIAGQQSSDAASNRVSHVDLTWYDIRQEPRPGELWLLNIRMRTPHGFANPGGYDFEAQLLRQDVDATGYVRDAPSNRRLSAPTGYLRGYWVLRARSAIAARLESALPNSEMLGIVQGLAVGETSRMTSEQWRVFAQTGTTHLMAISGMHIGMVALWIAWLAGRGVRVLKLQRARMTVAGIQAVVGMISAIAYSALAGFSVPTQRTLIMLCVFFGARLLRAEVAPTKGLGIALILVLLIDPFAPLAPGFWLSFGAVAAIFLSSSGAVVVQSRLREYGRLQFIVTIGLLPLVMGSFGAFSLISPLVNLIAIPFFTLLIVPLVLIASALLFVSETLGSFAIGVVVFLLEQAWHPLEWASGLPMALWSFPQPPTWAFALMLVGTLVILSPGVTASRLAGALLCLPALCWQPTRPRDGEFTLTMLDVGQGLSVVITTRSRVLVYDAGPNFRSGRDTGEMVVAPYLRAKGVRRIDTLVVSHGDADHVGGMKGLIERIPVSRFLFGPSVQPVATSAVCTAGQSWTWDDVRFEFLYPPALPAAHRRNDTSCVLNVVGTGGSAVLLGDIERASEEWLIDHRAIAKVDIAIVPHHGSRTSSTDGLVSASSPRYALISAGFGNQWGFPKADVLARWQNSGAEPLQTADSGAIEIAVTQEGVAQPRRYRRDKRRYWRK